MTEELEDAIVLRTDNPCTGTQVYLHSVNWNKHVEKHPELEGHLSSVRATVEDPDFALQNDEGVVFKYRQGLGTGKVARLRLMVIESPDADGAHYIKTAYFTPDIDDSSVLCVRRL